MPNANDEMMRKIRNATVERDLLVLEKIGIQSKGDHPFHKMAVDAYTSGAFVGAFDHVGPFIPEGAFCIDVGCFSGGFTMKLLANSLGCFSFDANGEMSWLDMVLPKKSSFTHIAAGSGTGRGVLTIPADMEFWSYASMDTSKAVKCKRFFNEHNCEKQAVRVDTLDKFLSKKEGPIGFMRIDVGGSELDVLKGSKDIIKQWFPNIHIRIERPTILGEIRRLLYGLGYRGLFFYNNEMFDLGVFDSKVHQSKKFSWSEKNHLTERPLYVEDFFFIPSSVPEE